MGRLDHVHIRVPDRTAAARWYLEHLGFEPVDTFLSFARSLPCGIDNPRGEPLTVGDLVDFDLCWAFDLVDPWDNKYELNCDEYDRIRPELVEAGAVEPVRYWPRQLYVDHVDDSPS